MEKEIEAKRERAHSAPSGHPQVLSLPSPSCSHTGALSPFPSQLGSGAEAIKETNNFFCCLASPALTKTPLRCSTTAQPGDWGPSRRTPAPSKHTPLFGSHPPGTAPQTSGWMQGCYAPVNTNPRYIKIITSYLNPDSDSSRCEEAYPPPRPPLQTFPTGSDPLITARGQGDNGFSAPGRTCWDGNWLQSHPSTMGSMGTGGKINTNSPKIRD